MRHLLALGAACALSATAAAQSGTVTGGTTTTRVGGGAVPSMPGQAVGTGFSLPGAAGSTPQPVGQKLPQVGNALSRPYDPSRPLDVFKGTGIDPKSVVAPISAFPPVPGPQPDLVDRLYAKLTSFVSFAKPTAPLAQPPNVTPGIFRRNRERLDERMWRRD